MKEKEIRTLENYDDITDIIIIGSRSIRRRYTFVDDSHDRQVIAYTILNLDCKHTNKLMHELGIWDDKTYVCEYNSDELFDMINTANGYGCEVHMDIYVLHDYFLFGFVDPRDNTKYVIQGLSDEHEEWENILNLDSLISTILSSDDKFNIYKSITNQN